MSSWRLHRLNYATFLPLWESWVLHAMNCSLWWRRRESGLTFIPRLCTLLWISCCACNLFTVSGSFSREMSVTYVERVIVCPIEMHVLLQAALWSSLQPCYKLWFFCIFILFNLCRTKLATTSSAHCSKYLELGCLNPHFVTSFLHDLVQSIVCLSLLLHLCKGPLTFQRCYRAGIANMFWDPCVKVILVIKKNTDSLAILALLMTGHISHP